MSRSETECRTALARSKHLCPGFMAYRKPNEPSKQDLKDMLREAVENTAKIEVE